MKLVNLYRSTLLTECIIVGRQFDDGDIVLYKNRDRNYNPRIEIVRELTPYGVELCYVHDTYTDWCEGMNEFGIGVVNSALFVERDEKEYDKSKKKKAPSKDGERILEALRKDNLNDALQSLLTFHGGIKGHTIVSDGKTAYTIEATSELNPIVTPIDLKKSPIVRTNHGIEDPSAGYQDGDDKYSSETRLVNAINTTWSSNDWQRTMPLFRANHQPKGPKFDLVRDQNKLWTSSQLALNLTKCQMIFYLIPDRSEFVGVTDNTRPGYNHKIKINIFRYKN